MKRILCFAVLAATAQAAAIRPVELKCEYRSNPAGIDEKTPRLSWRLAATVPAARNLKQSAYRVLAASSPAKLAASQGDLWDSGKQTGGQSVLVPWAGKALTSGEQVWWKVQVWDQAGALAPWSETAHWTMGLLEASDWQGKWIGKEPKDVYKNPNSPQRQLEGASWIWFDEGDPAVKAPAETRWFKSTVTLPANRKLKTAWYVFGADNSFEMTVNGHYAGRGRSLALPAVIDIAPWLKAGENTISVKAANSKEDAAGAIGALKVEFSTGAPLEFKTGAGWQASKTETGDYTAVKVLGPFGMQPWGEVGVKEEQALPARYLRKEFKVAAGLKRATVYVSGLGLGELYVNGARPDNDVLSPGLTDYSKRTMYVTRDITKLVTPGANALGLILGNGRYWQVRGRLPAATKLLGPPKAMVQMLLEYANGKTETVVSDETWKLTSEGPLGVNNEYDGEDYDARREMPGWARAGFKDAKWEPVELVSAPQGPLVAQMAEPLKVIETLTPKTVKELRPGVFIYDFGQNMVGWCRLKVAGPKGSKVTIRFAETLRPDGSLYVDNLRSARSIDTYWLKGGAPEVWEPRFTYHGFRFVEVIGYPGKPTLASIDGRVVHDAMERAGTFESSDEMLNKLHHNIFWGIRGNYRSIPTDCPQRDEKQGWLGDRSVVCVSESYMYDVAAFHTKWETDIRDAQRESGSIPDVAPAYWSTYNDGIVWPSTFVLVPNMLYRQYGDTRVIERNYPAMRKWIEYMNGFLQDGIMPKNTYADWCVPPEKPDLIHSTDPTRVTRGALLSTAYYYHMLGLMSDYAKLIGKSADSDEYTALAAKVKQAFLREYYKAQDAMFDNGTQTSSILPLAFDMVPDGARDAVFSRLTSKIVNESNSHVGVGLVGAQWLMRALSDNGRTDLALTIATQKTYPGWGYMIEQGATTVWELWNGNTADPAMNSGNHVMQIGDLGMWMYEYLAGIRPDPAQPGFRHFFIKPETVSSLSFAKASHKSPYGEIKSEWKRTAGKLTLNVTVPPNSTATIYVPGAEATEQGGLKATHTEKGAVVFEAGSGNYTFTAQ
jgi:alpha-L-rhamnosidase